MLDEERLVALYYSGKSMMEISKLSNCSVHKVKYWIDKYSIKKRNRSEAAYVKQNPNGDPFKIKLKLNLEENILYGLAVGIYWGEGTKITPHSVRVTNTDPAMLIVFIKFLKQICGVQNNKINYSIVCFNDTDPDEAKKYWSNELEIYPEKFGKITQIPQQGKGTYKKKSKFGVCTVTVNNIKLKSWMMNQIELVKELKLARLV
jgi:hypothetical protein